MSHTRLDMPQKDQRAAQVLVRKSREAVEALHERRAVGGARLRLRDGVSAEEDKPEARETKQRLQGVEGRSASQAPEGKAKLALSPEAPQTLVARSNPPEAAQVPREKAKLALPPAVPRSGNERSPPEAASPCEKSPLPGSKGGAPVAESARRAAELAPPASAGAARPALEKVAPATAGSASTGQTERPSTKSLVLRKKQESAFEGGRDVALEREPDPVCCNCQVSFSVDEDLEPLARIVCPRCNTRQVVPARIGHFVLERELGRGGMGVTYRAFDRSLLRNVAVKLISEKRAGDREHIESIVREARRAATLSHPHIVPVHSIGSVEGRPYFVMEMLSDSQFSRRVAKGGQLDEVFVLETGLAVARALAEAAAHGILHLDVKPANILHDRFGSAKLIDFGLACDMSDERSHGWGTCLYMAPERLRRRGQDIRSDQYSLGITMWQALAGKRPFEAEDNDALSSKILKEAPPLLNQTRADILDWTAGLVHKMISYDAAERYQDYAELIWAFEYVLGTLRGTTSGQTASTDSP